MKYLYIVFRPKKNHAFIHKALLRKSDDDVKYPDFMLKRNLSDN